MGNIAHRSMIATSTLTLLSRRLQSSDSDNSRSVKSPQYSPFRRFAVAILKSGVAGCLEHSSAQASENFSQFSEELTNPAMAQTGPSPSVPVSSTKASRITIRRRCLWGEAKPQTALMCALGLAAQIVPAPGFVKGITAKERAPGWDAGAVRRCATGGRGSADRPSCACSGMQRDPSR